MIADKSRLQGKEESHVNREDGDVFSYLERKINVNRAAILQAIGQVGNDKAKVEEYLTNTRGL